MNDAKLLKPVLVATPHRDVLESIRQCLAERYHVVAASDFSQCLSIFQKRRYEFTFIDIDWLSQQNSQNDSDYYKGKLQVFWDVYPTAEIVVLTNQQRLREAVHAVKAGAATYLIFPVNPDEIIYLIEKIIESRRKDLELNYLRNQYWDKDFLDVVKTRSPEMKSVFDKIRSVAPTKTTVMLYGETGTGKGVMAGLIHAHSNRRGQPFISVHCGAIPDTLLESELFGHEKGAFTGAVKRKLGKFEIARGGTIFLDEIGTITPAAQIKLLQVLQDRTFQRVGGDTTIVSDARILAATNHDLKKMVEEGSFRKDLYYRLNVFPVEIPPLADRKEDIPLLVETFLKRLNRYYGKHVTDIHPEVLKAFQSYCWPGNIRELENLVERAHILEPGPILKPERFPNELLKNGMSMTTVTLKNSETLAEFRRRGIEKIEQQYLKELLSVHRGKINESAKAAGISTRQLHKLLTRYSIRKQDFK
jgi:DNA-binding NtrC family response regulator